MVRQAFRDPKVFWAYVGTKIAVFVVAAAATWPLARLIGPQAWIGLGVFGGILLIMALAVLFGPSTAPSADVAAKTSEAGIDALDEIDPDLPFEIAVEDSLDLHPFRPRDVPDVVGAYLETAAEKGYSEVRLIHGRGIGLQRDRVHKLLARHPMVVGFHDAPPERGGWGATIAYLKKKF